MARVLAIDYGTKRVGIAVTDELQLIASALVTVHTKDIIVFLKDYCQKEKVESIVVGMPINLKGENTHSTSHVVGFVRTLKKIFPETAIHTHDERFTSSMAMQSMLMSGVSKKDRRDKSQLDKVAATIILQSFMDKK